jgi:hypothetical protein
MPTLSLRSSPRGHGAQERAFAHPTISRFRYSLLYAATGAEVSRVSSEQMLRGL